MTQHSIYISMNSTPRRIQRKDLLRSKKLVQQKWKVDYRQSTNGIPVSTRYFKSMPKMSEYYGDIKTPRLTRLWLGLHKYRNTCPWELRTIAPSKNGDCEFV